MLLYYINRAIPHSAPQPVADPGVVRLVRPNPPDPSLPRVIILCNENKLLSVPVILDVRLQDFGSLGLVYYSYNGQLTGSFVVLLAAARFSGKRDRKGGYGQPKSGRG